jgi:hypothetical protein
MKTDAGGARDIDSVIQTLCWPNKLNSPIDQLKYMVRVVLQKAAMQFESSNASE